MENDYNLNIPRYVDTFEEEEPISLIDVSKELEETQQSLAQAHSELLTMAQDLTATTSEADEELQAFINF